MTDILNHMKGLGFEPGAIIADGRVHRYGDGKKSNWYIAFQNWTRNGELCHVVQFGSWKTGEIHTWNSNVELTADDKTFIQKKIKEAQKKEKEEKERGQNEVAEQCSKFWETLGTVELPPYCQRKKMRDLYGARSKGSDLFVPMRDIDGKLWGLQRIQSDGQKFFSPGQRVANTFHLVGTLESVDSIYVAEGFATATSIYAALEKPVVVAFNSNNLSQVSEAIRKKYPEARIVICADNDQWTTKKIDGMEKPYNPGIDCAEKAAAKIGASIVVPSFENLEGRPTDFNDLHLREGLEKVHAQIAPVKARKSFVVPLGFKEKEYFFTSTSNPQIVPIRTFSDVEFYNLMPREYWEAAFPAVKGGADLLTAKSELMEICRSKGIFESRHVRGSGVWLDEGRIVVNMGDHLLVDGNRVEIYEIKSRFFYTLGKALPELAHSDITVDECELLVKITENFKWQRPEFAPLMAGALVISKISGALPVRPHLWLTGGSQTGKSTLMEQLIFPTLKGHSLYFLGGTSEAGLRQSLGSNSVPVIFDEFETNGPKSSENIQACIELMRSSWSESNGVIAKGSSGGNAIFYQPRFSAIVSSIRPNLQSDADRSRFTIIELVPHGSDPKHWAKLSGLLSEYDELFINRLFIRTIKMIPVILESYDVFRKALAQKVGARFGQQYGMLLAGYWSLKSDEPVTRTEADGMIAALDFAEEQDEARLTDELELVAFLTTTKLRTKDEERSISSLIQAASRQMTNPMALDHAPLLETYGIKVEGATVSIASNHAALKDVLRATKWANCWPKTLARVEGAQKNQPKRFSGKVLKSTTLPISLFI